MLTLELSHLRVRAPAQIANPGISEKETCNSSEASVCIKLRCTFIGNGFAMSETVLVGRADCHFVKPLCVYNPALDACDFCLHECSFSLKVRGTMERPYLELSMMVIQLGKMLAFRFRRSRVPGSSMGQCGKEAEV